MGTLIVFVLAVPMACSLGGAGRCGTPPASALAAVPAVGAGSTGMLGLRTRRERCPGTVPTGSSPSAFNLAGYVVGDDHPALRRQPHRGGVPAAASWSGSWAAVPRGRRRRPAGHVRPAFEFTSPVEMLLPGAGRAERLRAEPGAPGGRPAPGGARVHPPPPGRAVRLHEHLGQRPRPAAAASSPSAGSAGPGAPGRRLAGVVDSASAAMPVVVLAEPRASGSAWALTVVFCRRWLARTASLAGVGALVVGAVTLGGGRVLASPLTGVVAGNGCDNPQSDGIRAFTISRTLEVRAAIRRSSASAPPAGALGSSNSIAVGRDADCAEAAATRTLGSNGQLWLLLIAQGVVGAALYVGFPPALAVGLPAGPTPLGRAGHAGARPALSLHVRLQRPGRPAAHHVPRHRRCCGATTRRAASRRSTPRRPRRSLRAEARR